jgi:hypothetical protein
MVGRRAVVFGVGRNPQGAQPDREILAVGRPQRVREPVADPLERPAYLGPFF